MNEINNENKTTITIEPIFMIIGFILLIILCFVGFPKYIKIFTFEKTQGTFVEKLNCINNTCSYKYRYNRDYYYITPYRTEKKPKEIEKIYYNPNNINDAYTIDLSIDIVLILFALMLIFVPLGAILDIKKGNKNIKNICLTVPMFIIPVIFLLFGSPTTNYVAIFFIVCFILLYIFNKSKNTKLKRYLYSSILILMGLLISVVFFPSGLIAGLMLIVLGAYVLFKEATNKSVLENANTVDEMGSILMTKMEPQINILVKIKKFFSTLVSIGIFIFIIYLFTPTLIQNFPKDLNQLSGYLFFLLIFIMFIFTIFKKKKRK